AMERAFVDLIRRVEPSVVSIARLRPSPSVSQFNPFEVEMGDARGEATRPEAADFVPNEFGAGVIVAPLRASEGRFVLTNYHVVRGGPILGAPLKTGESQLYVRFADRRGYYARIIAADPRSDLAVL